MDMNKTFSVDYYNGEHSEGEYYSEPLTLGDKRVHNVPIGLTEDEPMVSRMGVGASAGGPCLAALWRLTASLIRPQVPARATTDRGCLRS